MRFVRWVAAVVAVLACSSTVAAQTWPKDSSEKIELAVRYYQLTHYEQRIRESTVKSIRASWTVCKDQQCQADLDRDVDQLVAKEASAITRLHATALASRVSKEDLLSAINFINSPSGRAINQAYLSTEDEVFAESRPVHLKLFSDLNRMICTQHPNACTKGGVPLAQ